MQFARVLLLSLLGLCTSSFGQVRLLESTEASQRAAEGIVASIAASNFTGALKEMKSLAVVPAAEFEVFEAQFNSQVGQLLARFGAASGYELVCTSNAGTHLSRYQFLVLHEKAPVRWTFVFYRQAKGWAMTDFKFDATAQEYFRCGA